MPAASAGEPSTDAPAVALRDARLDQAQQLVGDQRQRRRRGAAEQHEDPVLGLQAGEDVVAEAGLADRRRQRRRADGPDRGGAHAGHDHRRGQRQLDPEEPLARRHADAVGGLDHGRIDAGEPGDAVPQDRQHRIERQRQQRRQEAERRKAEPKAAFVQRRERQQQRIEQRQQRQAGNGLHQAGDRQRRPAHAAVRLAATASGRLITTPSASAAAQSSTCCAEIVGQQLEGGGDALIHRRPSSAAAMIDAHPLGLAAAACPSARATSRSRWPASSAAACRRRASRPALITTIRSASSTASGRRG